MATENPLLRFVAYPLALGACVAICLWVFLMPLRIDQLAFGLQKATEPEPPRPIVSSDSGPWVKHMQQALIKRGYFVGSTGADGDFNDDTMAALATFQDSNGLVVQQQCDRQCWTALRLPGQKPPEPALLRPIVSNDGGPRVKQMQPVLTKGAGELAGELAGALAGEAAALAAPQQVEGEIVKLDKANRQITLQRAGAPAERYLLDHDPSFDTLKVGDQVTLKIDLLNGVPTVTFILSK